MTPTTIRAGDRLPALRLTPDVGCGESWDPSEYSTFTLELFGPATHTGSMTVDTATGELVYAWPAGSTAVPGTYAVIVRAVTAGGLQRTFPPAGAGELVIEAMPG